MSLYYVACFPNLSEADSWISDFRVNHDPKASRVGLHMTFVFPTKALSECQLVTELNEIGRNTKKFAVHCRSALAMPEKDAALGLVSSVFLVPDEGFGEAVRLHSRLYANSLQSELRLDVPFIPHLTIGSSIEMGLAKREVDKLNSNRFRFSFEVENLTIVKVTDVGAVRQVVQTVALSL